jgi:hypothetical protein
MSFGTQPSLEAEKQVRRYSAVTDALVQPMTNLSRYVKFLFVFYIVISLLYIVAHFYSLMKGNYFMRDLESLAAVGSSSGEIVGRITFEPQQGVPKPFEIKLDHIPQDLVYSKLFQYALKPTKIIPYFLRMKSNPLSTG